MFLEKLIDILKGKIILFWLENKKINKIIFIEKNLFLIFFFLLEKMKNLKDREDRECKKDREYILMY